MDDIPSPEDAYLEFRSALTAVLDEYNAASNHGIEATDLAKENLKRTHEQYLRASKSARDFFDVKLHQIKVLQEALHTNALDTNQIRDHLVSLVRGQEDLESEARNVDNASASEECDTAESQAVSDLDPNKPETKEAVKCDTAESPAVSDLDPNEPEPEEAVKHKHGTVAAPQDTDLDPN
jgi:hypothetical protein